MFQNEPKATIDFETRSVCSIRNCGTWRYSVDASTEVLCLAYRLPHWTEGRTGLWHPAFPEFNLPERADDDLAELFEWLRKGGLVEAHNAWFERGIWNNIMVPTFGWPVIAHEQWRCSAAKAATYALPRSLEKVGAALGLDIQKDVEGGKLMKKMSVPRKALKADIKAWGVKHAQCWACDGKGKVARSIFRSKQFTCPDCGGLGYDPARVPSIPVLWHEGRELLERLCQYCRVDVLAEEQLSHSLRDLNTFETVAYLVDQAANERGFHLDAEAIQTALELIDIEFADLNAELRELTGGEVEKATQRERMLTWLEAQGLELEDTTKETVAATLERSDLLPHVRRAVELMKQLGRSSTAKYIKMASWVCPDSRVHGGLLYHGAATGRWSGQGVQPHNFVKGKVKDMEAVWTAIRTKSRDVIQSLGLGAVMDVLAQALRGAITASPGKMLYVADYAAIEARVVAWLAGQEDALDVFRRGEDVYCWMAEKIYGYPVNKTDHPTERAFGKIAILGLGYQMGWKKFKETCEKFGMVVSDELAQMVVEQYRSSMSHIKDMWTAQERAAIRAVESPGRRVRCGKVTWFVEGRFLHCELPSGRWLGYPDPEIRTKPTPWGEERPVLTFKGINQYTKKWERQTTYGGMLVENITQAVARDLMAEAMVRCFHSGTYTVILSVHDELVAEGEPGHPVHEFEALMSRTSKWAEGLPVEAEGWTGFRYRK